MTKKPHWLDVVTDILAAPTSDLRELATISGSDPTAFYVGTNLDGVDVRGQDLRGMKFTGISSPSVVRDQHTLVDPDADLHGEPAPDLSLAPASPAPTEDKAWRVEVLRDRVARALELHLALTLHRVGQSQWIDEEQGVRVVVVTSKRYRQKGQDYWYAYHKSRRDFLAHGTHGYLALSGFDLGYVVALPFVEMERFLSGLAQSDRRGNMYWHIKARLRDDDYRLVLAGREVSVSEYKVEL